MFKLTVATVLAALSLSVNALTIAQIQGTGFNSPYNGQAVTDVSGVVTAIGPSGIWIRSAKPDKDDRTSDSIYVFTGTSANSIRTQVTVGQTITIDGKVEEYRSSKDYLYLTEITSPTNLRASDEKIKAVQPIVLDRKRQPPTQLYTSLDTNSDIFALPNNASLIETSGLTLQPEKYGLDFWESLEGELVTIKKPISLGLPNNYGDFWVRGGDWKVTGENKRGGLTIIPGKGKAGADANPEVIVIGEPLDKTKNDASIRLGDSVEDITGVVTYAFGFYRILPTTGVKIRKAVTPGTPEPTKLKSDKKCALTFGSYNVENLSPSSAHLGSVASHIVDYLGTPDLVFLQEVQDNNGATNNGVVDASETLKTLADAIFALSGVQYSFTDIAPTNNQDGGAPGGNIRTSYFYNPDTIVLKDSKPGTATDAVAIQPNGSLNFNPGRIEPANAAWTASRKPLVALFQAKNTKKPKNIYTINVHFGSKGGSSSTHGDARPPVNGGVEDRLAQATLVKSFVQTILKQDKNAQIIASGDFNEFAYVEPMKIFEDVMYDMDEVVNIKEEERYTYLYDGNSQQLDHTLVSKSLKSKAKYEHIHVNTWSKKADQVSDHDPSVARLDVC